MSLNEPASINSMLKLIFPLEQAINSNVEKIDSDISWHFYSHAIRRNPSDLKSHTRRIFIAMQHNNAELLSGALHDLFVTLKSAGKQLRIRLLKASAPHLERDEIIYFAKWIKSDSDSSYGYKWVAGSMLCKGLSETDSRLMNLKEESNEAKLSAIDEARSCIEYGQLDLAKKILEEAIVNDKNNPELQEELNNLLKYTDSSDEQNINQVVGE